MQTESEVFLYLFYKKFQNPSKLETGHWSEPLMTHIDIKDILEAHK